MIDFIRYRKAAAAASALLIASFIGMAFYRWQAGQSMFNYSIDFTGGTQVLLKFENQAPVDLKRIIESAGWINPEIRDFSAQERLVRVKEFTNDAQGVSVRMKEAVQTALPDQKVEILQVEGVGPGVGADLWFRSIKAIALSFAAIFLYIFIRIWAVGFAVGAVVALVHDALMMLLVFMLLQREISVNVIGAILAVIGYSINDTIIIFSQIRKNIATMGNASIEHIVNVSLNQTLRRTMLTSISTGIAVLAMLLIGGEGLFDSSLALLVGIVFGTYSSIYMASPVMMLFHNKKK